MTTQSPPPRLPLGAVIGIIVLGLVGVAMLTYSVIALLGTGEPTPTQVAARPTPVIIIPTNTQPPRTAAPTQPPTDTAPPAPAVTDTPSGPVVRIAQPANVRSGPGVNYPILGGLPVGTEIPAIGRDSSAQWFVISYSGGQGWVSNLVATYNGDVNALPVIAAPPPPAATATTVPPTAAPTSVAVPTAAGVRGIRGDSFSVDKTSVAVNEDIWFNFQVTNTTDQAIAYGGLGAIVIGGPQSQFSYGDATLNAHEVLPWRDHMNIGTPGTYTLYLGICFAASRSACEATPSAWQVLYSTGVTVKVN
jgi:hypothetical protein